MILQLRDIRRDIAKLESAEKELRKNINFDRGYFFYETDVIKDIIIFSDTFVREMFFRRTRDVESDWIPVSSLKSYIDDKYGKNFSSWYIKSLLYKLYGETIFENDDSYDEFEFIKKVWFKKCPEDGYYANRAFVNIWKTIYIHPRVSISA